MHRSGMEGHLSSLKLPAFLLEKPIAMRNASTWTVLLLVLLGASCARIYETPDARYLASRHEVIAIVPPKVNITPRKNVDPELLARQEKLEAEIFQREMYSWLLRRKMQGRMFIEVQDVETTNVRLRRAGYFANESLTPAEMCELLEVDGLITSRFALAKPLSEGAAIALGVIFDVWGPTNQTSVYMELHDASTRQVIWNFNHRISGSVGSTSQGLVDDLMRRASKKMPYTW